MIQILGLRDYNFKGKVKKREVYFEKGWRLERVQDVFNPVKIQQIIDMIPEAERYNMYFTVADCYEESGRKLKEQWAIPFDIDKLQLSDPETGEPYTQQDCVQIAERAARSAITALEVQYEDVAIVYSGNGVQLFIFLDKPIVDEGYFDKSRPAYAAIARKIQNQLNADGVHGEIDTSVWSAGRLMRMPNTRNIKKDKAERTSYIINEGGKSYDYDVYIRSGVTETQAPETLDKDIIKNYPAPDTEAVCTGCKFLVYCKSNPEKINEPQWYAMTSITARLDNGEDLTHRYSEGHSGYNPYETELKIEQALKAAGPRTCKDIDTRWGGCNTCDYYGKVTSPIMIKGENYIASKDFGFRERKQVEGEDGKISIKPGRVAFLDLIKAFHQEHSYKVVKDNEQTIIYNGKHWEFITDLEIGAWATTKVRPEPSASEMSEFITRLKRYHVTSLDNLHEQQDGFMNFQNCVLNMNTMETFTHAPSYGFFNVLPYAYDAHAKAPAWERFLLDVMGGDKAMAQTLKEFGGYCISGDKYWLHKALMLVGDGANGKSVFMEVLGEVVGKSAHSAVPVQEFTKNTMRYQLVNKLFNYSEETSTRALNESEPFKILAAGGSMSVKQLYIQEYNVANKAKLIMSANSMPYSADKSEGLLRRLAIVKFNQRFKEGDGKHDFFIKDKLLLELSGICNSLIEAYKTLKTNRVLTGHSQLSAATEEYRLDSDSVLRFIKDVVVPQDDVESKAAEVYAEYVRICEMDQLKPVNGIAFGKQFKKITGIESVLRKKNNDVYRVYPNVRINKEY